MTLQDKNPTEIQIAAVKTNAAVLKRWWQWSTLNPTS
jgi:hypothetical protein